MEKIEHIFKQQDKDGWYLVGLDEVNEDLANGWRVKMLSSYGPGDIFAFGTFVVLERDD